VIFALPGPPVRGAGNGGDGFVAIRAKTKSFGGAFFGRFFGQFFGHFGVL
jgi:hypothetical protein